jgi:hypothetical protein
VRITTAHLPMMTAEALFRFKAEATVKLRKAGSDQRERGKWSAALLAVDQEIAKRKPADANRGPHKVTNGETLAQRVLEAQEAIYGPLKPAAKVKAEGLRRDMEASYRRVKPNTSLPEDSEAVRERARRVMHEMTGGKG